MTRKRLAALLIGALLLAGLAAPVLAAPTGEAAGTSLLRKDLQVMAGDGAGVVTISVYARDAALLEAYSAGDFQVIPLYGEPEAAAAADVPRAPADRGGAISTYAPGPRSAPAVQLVFDDSGLEPAEGVAGYEVIVRGHVPPATSHQLALRKPPTWLVVHHWYQGGNRIGIKARIRCHSASMWTLWATWTTIFYGQSHCPPHGAELLVPGSSTHIEVQFDGAYLTQYETWRDNSTTIWTFFPGEF